MPLQAQSGLADYFRVGNNVVRNRRALAVRTRLAHPGVGIRRLRNGTLGTKMAVLSGCVAVVACLSLALLAYFQAAAGLRSQERALLNTDALLTTSAIQRWHAQQFAALDMIARVPAVQRVLENGAAASTADVETAQATLDALTAVLPELESVGLMDRTGTSRYDSDPATVGLHVPERDYFVDAMLGNRFVSDLDISVVTNQPAIFHSVPVKNGAGSVIGVARSRASMRAIEAVVQAASGKDGAGGLGILIDDDGLVILNSRNPSWLLRPIVPLDPSHEAALAKSLKWGRGSAPQSIDAPDLAQAIGVRDNVSLSIAVDGAQYDALASPIGEGSWTYVTARPAAPFDALARDSVRNGLAVSLAAALAVVFMGYRIRRGAYRDALTGLPNRTLLLERLSTALLTPRHAKSRVAVLLVDLDRFNVINDSLGHAAGDELLIAVSERLRARLGDHQMIARVGGDEFMLFIEELQAHTDATIMAERVLVALDDPIDLNGRSVYIAASIGIAFDSGPGAGPEQLLREADLALYRAKAAGRGRYAVFETHMESGALERLDIEMGLRQALERGELRVYYQPIISLRSGHVTEVEALVRWAHPTRGIIPPTEFIPIAEETGLILPLGHFVLREAAQQVRTWQRLYRSRPPLIVGVNLSGRQLAHPGLINDIQNALEEADLDPRCLKLEITESVVMQDAEATISTLHHLKAMGIQLAIDDFGTGYSSLSYLKRFPIDTLKIDRSFVAGVADNPQDAAIVRSVVALAQALGLSVTSEGIETPGQEAYLRELGCDFGQGYLFARPQAAEHIGPLLRERNYAPRLKWAA
jgi:diguanylate cyclase (GGDEF)-like protein